MVLSNRQKADLLKYAYRNAPLIDYGIYQLRLALFCVFDKTVISADRVANFFMPPGQPLGSRAWSSMEYLIDTIARDARPDMKETQLYLLLTDY
ncbi:hypothetical protein [Pseudomonas fluorescens]|uniref:Uncharacterized protein n=1 Tax=Pseudomonas fluorescens TaxID=294 RepID=A0A5E7HY07_PSEFL|nr:hypothetical protein [Pseudomonas fluorescens]VVO69074.1 hypothetical protein PS847_01209 [Pseudomonas fluorescens]